MVGIAVEMDLDQRGAALEDVDFIVDGYRVLVTQIGLHDIAARNVAIGPFVEPQAIGPAQPFGRSLSRFFPAGRIAADDILIAAMARLQDERVWPWRMFGQNLSAPAGGNDPFPAQNGSDMCFCRNLVGQQWHHRVPVVEFAPLHEFRKTPGIGQIWPAVVPPQVDDIYSCQCGRDEPLRQGRKDPQVHNCLTHMGPSGSRHSYGCSPFPIGTVCQ